MFNFIPGLFCWKKCRCVNNVTVLCTSISKGIVFLQILPVLCTLSNKMNVFATPEDSKNTSKQC